MRARKIIKVNPPERQVLQTRTAALLEGRLKRKWGKFNRHAIAGILGDLHLLRLASDSEPAIRAVTRGLFLVIQDAQKVLLSLTTAPGIIFQCELEAFCRERRIWKDLRVAERPDASTAPFVSKWAKLCEHFEAGWLVEPGRFGIWEKRDGVICIGEFGQSSRRAPRPDGIETPTPEQLQAWFDLPSATPPA
jgi:hypothetical protein